MAGRRLINSVKKVSVKHNIYYVCMAMFLYLILCAYVYVICCCCCLDNIVTLLFI